MNNSPSIHVPAKRTDEVDWANPLKRYIQTTYQEDPEKYVEEANAVHRLRQDMRGAGKDLTGRDLLYRYYGQLELLDLRFPVDENHIRISFTWYDAFTHKGTSQYSLAYEKASTIFNIASVLSAIASSQNRSEIEGLKRAFHFFQASAGMFTYINDNFLHAPSTDLSRDTVNLLSQLMLTQAQECFLEQSLGAKKKPALIAKLAAQASWSYGNIVETMGDLVSKSIFDKSWLTVCQIKHKYLGSIAQYQKALACETEHNYGESVGRLNLAESLAKESNKLAVSFVSAFSASATPTLSADAAVSLQELNKSNLALISEKTVSATRDNDIVYHAVVPQESVIPPIDKLNAVKSMPIQDLYGPNEIQKVIGADIFQRLIPLSVHESASLYSEEKAKIVRSETERCDVANGELEASLEFMKLPGALEKFKNSKNSRSFNDLAAPTAEVEHWSQLVKEEELKGTVKDLMVTLDGLKGRANELLDGVAIILDTEQRECETLRVKYGDAWSQSPSGQSTAVLRQDLRNHRNSLEQAANSDRHLYHRYEQVANDIAILLTSGKSDELERVFTEALVSSFESGETSASGISVKIQESLLDVDASSSEDIPLKIQKVEECLSNLHKVKKERMDTLGDLKEKTHQDDISHLLILNKKTQNIEPQLFATELEKFTPYRNRITASIHHQQALLQELTKFYKSLLDGETAKILQTQWEQAERKRKEVTECFRRAKDSYLEVKEGLSKGVQFYVDLADLVENLSQTAHQFVKTRQQERNELVQSLGKQEQQRLSDQLNKFNESISPSTSTVSPSTFDSIGKLIGETKNLSINTNSTGISNMDQGSLLSNPQTFTNNGTSYYPTSSTNLLNSYNPNELNAQPKSYTSSASQYPVSSYVPSPTASKPSISPSLPNTVTPSTPTNYISSTLTRNPSLKSITPSNSHFPNQPPVLTQNSQGPPVPPIPVAYQQQQLPQQQQPINGFNQYQVGNQRPIQVNTVSNQPQYHQGLSTQPLGQLQSNFIPPQQVSNSRVQPGPPLHQSQPSLSHVHPAQINQSSLSRPSSVYGVQTHPSSIQQPPSPTVPRYVQHPPPAQIPLQSSQRHPSVDAYPPASGFANPSHSVAQPLSSIQPSVQGVLQQQYYSTTQPIMQQPSQQQLYQHPFNPNHISQRVNYQSQAPIQQVQQQQQHPPPPSHHYQQPLGAQQQRPPYYPQPPALTQNPRYYQPSPPQNPGYYQQPPPPPPQVQQSLAAPQRPPQQQSNLLD